MLSFWTAFLLLTCSLTLEMPQNLSMQVCTLATLRAALTGKMGCRKACVRIPGLRAAALSHQHFQELPKWLAPA